MCVLLAVCLLSLCGCGKAPAGTEVLSNSQYAILEQNGEYSLEFKVDIPDEGSLGGSAVSGPIFQYGSVGDMKTAVERGNFSPVQLAGMQKFVKASNGNVAVCDLNKLWEPVLPDGLSVTDVYLHGLTYGVWVGGSGLEGEFDFITKEALDDYRETETVKETKYVKILSVTDEPERNGKVYIHYSSASRKTYKTVTYSYEDAAGRAVTIFENYYDYDKNATVPDDVIGLVEGNGVYCYWIVGGFTERPSLEWIKSLGIKPYAEGKAA